MRDAGESDGHTIFDVFGYEVGDVRASGGVEEYTNDLPIATLVPAVDQALSTRLLYTRS